MVLIKYLRIFRYVSTLPLYHLQGSATAHYLRTYISRANSATTNLRPAAKLISADVIAALGPDNVLVNSTRGTTIDAEALITTSQTKQLRGAALDVYNNEPNIDPRRLTLDNVVLQPHQSSGTVETRQRMGALQRENPIAFFNGKPPLTPVA